MQHAAAVHRHRLGTIRRPTRRRWLGAIGCVGMLAALGAAAPAAPAAPPVWQAVASTGDPAVGYPGDEHFLLLTPLRFVAADALVFESVIRFPFPFFPSVSLYETGIWRWNGAGAEPIAVPGGLPGVAPELQPFRILASSEDVNARGDVAFVDLDAQLQWDGVFVCAAGGDCRLVIRSGDAAPGGPEGSTIGSPFQPRLDGAGGVWLGATLMGPTLPAFTFGLFGSDGAGGLVRAFAAGDPLPGAPPGTTIAGWLGATPDGPGSAFVQLALDDGASPAPAAIARWSLAGDVDLPMQTGAPAPGTGGSFADGSIQLAVEPGGGWMAFATAFASPPAPAAGGSPSASSGATPPSEGLWARSPDGVVALRAKTGDLAPGGAPGETYVYLPIGPLRVNAAGDVAFAATTSMGDALFLSGADGTTVRLATPSVGACTAAPIAVYTIVSLTDAGSVFFTAHPLTLPSADSSDELYRVARDAPLERLLCASELSYDVAGVTTVLDSLDGIIVDPTADRIAVAAHFQDASGVGLNGSGIYERIYVAALPEPGALAGSSGALLALAALARRGPPP